MMQQLGNRYDLGYSYNTGGSNQNLTGSPDYGARLVLTGDPGKGCSSNQFVQFNSVVNSFLGSGLQTYNARVSVQVIEGNGRVSAYGSVIDNQSSDPTYVPSQ